MAGCRPLVVVLLLLATGVSCARVTIRKNPSDLDSGVRYYRPKPYLLLTPEAEGEFRDQHVGIQIQYLPDFSEEYAIDVRPGLGLADVSVTLDKGWNLTAINQKLDSQTDEIISAFGEVAGGIAKAAAAGRAGEGRFVVRASNVPLGLYEAVLGCDPCGRKQLFGWRYVGFLPYAACPTQGVGGQLLVCNEQPGPLFGLVFENGTLAFRRLDTVAPVPSQIQGVHPPLEARELERLPHP